MTLKYNCFSEALLDVFISSNEVCSEMLYNELVLPIEAQGLTEEDEHYDWFQSFLATGVKTVKSMEHFGGEDMGSTYYNVVKFTNLEGDTAYLKFDGWYASHEGAHFEAASIVWPQEKTIVVYK